MGHGEIKARTDGIRAAWASLAARFALPFDGSEQDWPWQVADASRFDEFIAAAADDLTSGERHELMEILVQCVDDLLIQPSDAGEAAWARIEPLLRANAILHDGTIVYWACLESTLEDACVVAARMRVLASDCGLLSTPVRPDGVPR